MPIVKSPHQDLYTIVRETRISIAWAKANILDDLLDKLEHLTIERVLAAPTPAPTLDADEARATVAEPVPEPEPTAPRKVTRRTKVDAEPEAEPTSAPSRIRAPKAAQVALPVQDAAPAPALSVAEADGDGPF